MEDGRPARLAGSGDSVWNPVAAARRWLAEKRKAKQVKGGGQECPPHTCFPGN